MFCLCNFLNFLHTIQLRKSFNMSTTKKTENSLEKAPKKKPYLNNADIMEELRKSHEKDQMTDKLVQMMYVLIDRIQRKLYYTYDEVRKDCRAHAMMVVVENWRKYKMDKDNPFAYFTRTVFNALAQSWNRNEDTKGHIHISLNAFINNDADKSE